MAKICGVIVLLMVGCSSAVESQPEVKPVDTDSFISSVNGQAKAIATTLAAQKLTGEMTLENTHAIITKLNKLEASLASPKPQQSGGDPASALQPPAKNANDSQTSTKIVAEPGAVPSETLVELATRLYAQGVNTHMKTEEQLKAIDAQLNRGQPVTGAIFPNNRTSAITSQRTSVRSLPQRVSFFGRAKYSTRQSCPSGRCPTR
jgi:hypothetical protein